VTVEAADFSPRKLLAEIGQAPPATADPKVLERLALKAAVKADAKTVTVSDGALSLDDSRLIFTVKVTEFAKPNLAFDLNLDQINVDRYLPPKAQKPQAGASVPPAGPSAAPAPSKADYTPLRQLVMNGTVKIGKLTVNKAKVEDVN
jgi:AsmA protein